MPKIKSSFSSKMREWISSANKNPEVFSLDGKLIFCIACGKHIMFVKENRS